MKIYAIIYYYYDHKLDWGFGERYVEFCATKDVARTRVEKLVTQSKRSTAYRKAQDKILENNRGKQYEEFKHELDQIREMYNNGYVFEYIPDKNERDIWIGDRCFPFVTSNKDDWDEFIEYLNDEAYEDKDDSGNYEHYLIKEIEVIE